MATETDHDQQPSAYTEDGRLSDPEKRVQELDDICSKLRNELAAAQTALTSKQATLERSQNQFQVTCDTLRTKLASATDVLTGKDAELEKLREAHKRTGTSLDVSQKTYQELNAKYLTAVRLPCRISLTCTPSHFFVSANRRTG